MKIKTIFFILFGILLFSTLQLQSQSKLIVNDDCKSLTSIFEGQLPVNFSYFEHILEKEIAPDIWKKISSKSSKEFSVSFEISYLGNYRVNIIPYFANKTYRTKAKVHFTKFGYDHFKKVADVYVSNTLVSEELEMTCFGGELTKSIFSKKEEAFSIYPNPTHFSFKVNSTVGPIDELSIFNLQGKLVASYQSPNESPIEIQNMKDGLYILKARIQKCIFTQKIVVFKK